MVADGSKLQSLGHALLASPASITSPCEQLFDIDPVRQAAQQSTRITAKTAQTKQYPSPGTRPTTSQIYRMDVAYQKPCSNFSHVLSHDINHVLKEEASKEAPSLCQHLAFRKQPQFVARYARLPNTSISTPSHHRAAASRSASATNIGLRPKTTSRCHLWGRSYTYYSSQRLVSGNARSALRQSRASFCAECSITLSSGSPDMHLCSRGVRWAWKMSGPLRAERLIVMARYETWIDDLDLRCANKTLLNSV